MVFKHREISITGLRNRAIGAHNMNEHSSRSHTILTVHIHSEEKASNGENNGVFITRNGKINFVDLAGYVNNHEIHEFDWYSIKILLSYRQFQFYYYILKIGDDQENQK